jgi:hypothetical protein
MQSILGKVKGVEAVGGAAEGVKNTMLNLDRLIWYAQIFLIGVSIIIGILFLVWLIRLVLKKKNK